MMSIINEEQIYKMLIKYINNGKFQETFKIINGIVDKHLSLSPDIYYSEVLNNIFMNLCLTIISNSKEFSNKFSFYSIDNILKTPLKYLFVQHGTISFKYFKRDEMDFINKIYKDNQMFNIDELTITNKSVLQRSRKILNNIFKLIKIDQIINSSFTISEDLDIVVLFTNDRLDKLESFNNIPSINNLKDVQIILQKIIQETVKIYDNMMYKKHFLISFISSIYHYLHQIPIHINIFISERVINQFPQLTVEEFPFKWKFDDNLFKQEIQKLVSINSSINNIQNHDYFMDLFKFANPDYKKIYKFSKKLLLNILEQNNECKQLFQILLDDILVNKDKESEEYNKTKEKILSNSGYYITEILRFLHLNGFIYYVDMDGVYRDTLSSKAIGYLITHIDSDLYQSVIDNLNLDNIGWITLAYLYGSKNFVKEFKIPRHVIEKNIPVIIY